MGKLNRYSVIFVLVSFWFPLLIQAHSAQQGAPAGSIAYIGSDRNVYTVQLSEMQFTQLTNDAAEERRYQWPTWSNDSQLAYFCCEPVTAGSLRLEVFVGTADTAASDASYAVSGQVFYHAFWSPHSCPEGERCRDLAILLNDTQEADLAIQIVRISEAEFRTFTIGTGQPFYYSWSPDGQRMLWQRGNNQLSVYDFAQDSVTDLQQTPGVIQAPQWSPVDDRLLFGALNRRDDTTDLIIVEGETITRLVEGIEGLVSYLWSPDGRHIAYRVISRNSLARVVVLDSATGQVIANPSAEGVYAFIWSPDSTRLAYVTVGQAGQGSSASIHMMPSLVRLQRQEESAVLIWSVLDIANGTVQTFDGFVPTPEMVYFFNFFDQFADSHHLCSAAEKLEDPIREYHGVKESRNDGTKTPQVYGTVQV